MSKQEDISASEVKRLMLANYRRYRNGEITENKAFKENAILGNILKAIEVSEEAERIEALEQAINRLKIEEE